MDALDTLSLRTNMDRHFFGSRNVGNGKAEMQGTLEMMRELYRQLDVPFPDGVEKYGMTNFSEKVKMW